MPKNQLSDWPRIDSVVVALMQCRRIESLLREGLQLVAEYGAPALADIPGSREFQREVAFCAALAREHPEFPPVAHQDGTWPDWCGQWNEASVDCHKALRSALGDVARVDEKVSKRIEPAYRVTARLGLALQRLMALTAYSSQYHPPHNAIVHGLFGNRPFAGPLADEIQRQRAAAHELYERSCLRDKKKAKKGAKESPAWLAPCMAALALNPELTNRELADKANVHPSTLSKDRTFRDAAQLCRAKAGVYTLCAKRNRAPALRRFSRDDETEDEDCAQPGD